MFEDRCKEVNRQYMLNNNAELDNGVYNEPEEKKAAKKDDKLTGMNEVIQQSPVAEQATPMIDSQMVSALNSLNNSAVMVDEERIESMGKFGYRSEYVLECLDNDELNHATTSYFLMDCEKEF